MATKLYKLCCVQVTSNVLVFIFMLFTNPSMSGMDSDCGSFFDANLPNAYENGSITDADVDKAIGNLARVSQVPNHTSSPGC